MGAQGEPTRGPDAGRGTPRVSPQLQDLARLLQDTWASSRLQRRSASDRATDERARLLAADRDREEVARRLAEAYAQGRLTSEELDQRTSAALAARTYGDLDATLEGLGTGRPYPGQPFPTGPYPEPAYGVVGPPAVATVGATLRKVAFWVVLVVASPFLALGGLLLGLGDDLMSRLYGVVVLLVTLPGVLALRRWAWPRRPRTPGLS